MQRLLTLLYITFLLCYAHCRNSDSKSSSDDSNDLTSTRTEQEYKCGCPKFLPSFFGRIVGGAPCKPHSWPWQTSVEKLSSKGRWFHSCGSSILAPRWILTAAHCVVSEESGRIPTGNIQVVIGRHNQTDPQSSERIIKVKRIVIHANYEGKNDRWRNDIAMLYLAEPIKYSAVALPVCLPDKPPSTSAICYSTGWGRTSATSKTSSCLREVRMTIYNTKTCNQPKWHNGALIPTMFCAGNPTEGNGTCIGDSGGPLVCLKNGLTWELAGLTSWAKTPCDRLNNPTVLTNVIHFKDWIQSWIHRYP